MASAFGEWQLRTLKGTSVSRNAHTGCVFRNGNKLYLFGGCGPQTSGTIHEVDPETGAVHMLEAAIQERYSHSATIVGDSMFVFGGKNFFVRINELYEFSFVTKAWTFIRASGTAPSPRSSHTGVEYKDSLFIFGGLFSQPPAPDRFFNDLFEYIPGSKKWVPWKTGPEGPDSDMPPPMSNHTAVVVGHSMLVFGGFTGTEKLDTLYKFNFDTRKWKLVHVEGPSPPPRFCHTAVVHDGNMYVFGGRTDAGAMNDFWEFDCTQERWRCMRSIGSVPDPRYVHVACVMRDVMVVHGGFANHDALGDLYLYTFPPRTQASLVAIEEAVGPAPFVETITDTPTPLSPAQLAASYQPESAAAAGAVSPSPPPTSPPPAAGAPEGARKLSAGKNPPVPPPSIADPPPAPPAERRKSVQGVAPPSPALTSPQGPGVPAPLVVGDALASMPSTLLLHGSVVSPVPPTPLASGGAVGGGQLGAPVVAPVAAVPVPAAATGALVTHFRTLSSDLMSMVDDKDNADCYIKTSRTLVHAHGAIIRARCPALVPLLIPRDPLDALEAKLRKLQVAEGSASEEASTACIEEMSNFVDKCPDCELEEHLLRCLLAYIYTDDVQDERADPPMLVALYAAAERFQLARLKALAYESMMERVTPQVVAAMVQSARVWKLKKLETNLTAWLSKANQLGIVAGGGAKP